MRATRTDKLLLILTALSVPGLALVAGAISLAHMRELALDHDQSGWKSYAFPISVDGLELVASLYLVACATLAGSGRSLSRDNLADAMRDDGHGVSNERASLLLKIVKAEHDVTTIVPASGLSRPDNSEAA